MVDASLGTKRTCPACGTRFYDLNRDPIECPSCHEKFTVEPILPSKQDQMADKPEEVVPEPAKEEVVDEPVAPDEVAAEDVDEAAAVADVDLDDVEVDVDPSDDTFLETDDEDAPVDDIIPAIKPDDEE